ncbi:MAG: ATP-dependent metallopeptidase FtsH/Yme1/Tma family protein, partial [Pseudomonadota bacterium]
MVVASLFNLIGNSNTQQPSTTVTYSEFLDRVEDGSVQSVRIDGERVTVTAVDGSVFRTVQPADAQLVDRMLEAGVDVEAQPQEQGLLMSLISIFGPFLLLMALLFFMMNRMQGGGRGGAMGFGKSRAKMLNERSDRVTFDDVAGIDEAKDELQEIVEFLRDPTKFSRLGGKIPKGALLVGPPGTGKTLLARAIAGEAGVPFFSISGSDFV